HPPAPPSFPTRRSSDLILGNDVAGLNADGSAGTLDPESVVFVVTPGLPTGSTVSPDGRTLTVPGEGVYTYAPNTEDPDASEVTLDRKSTRLNSSHVKIS